MPTFFALPRPLLQNLHIGLGALALGAMVLLAPGALAQGFPEELEISGLNGQNGFTVTGPDFGWVVSKAGDVNDDGVDDFLIGSPNGDPNFGTAARRQDAGISYVVFGVKGGITHPFALSTLDGSNGFAINGIADFDRAGNAISAAGDINGDGIADIIIGAAEASPGGRTKAGSVYVLFGKNTAFAPIMELSALDGSNGFAINGITADDRAGFSVSGAGDINGDGVDDVIIGATRVDPSGRNNAGAAYVFFGKATPFAASFELSALDGTNGFVINGVSAGEDSGTSVASAGDVNGDGVGDVIIGAPDATPGTATGTGAAYVVFGKANGFAAALEASALDGNNGFVIGGQSAADDAGISVAGAGDVNGDGFADVLVGAPNATPGHREGDTYLVFGKASGFPALIDLQAGALDGTMGTLIQGFSDDELGGTSVSAAGDVNGDGFADIVIGAPAADPTVFNNGIGTSITNAGISTVGFGHGGSYSDQFFPAAPDGNNGFRVNGAAVGDRSGDSVSAAGDVNGDGVDDIIIGGNSPLAAVVYGISAKTGASSIVSSVLPAARSGYFPGGPVVTVFASAINSGANRLDNCTISAPAGAPVTLSYQPANAANVLVGPADAPFTVNPGATRSFVLSFTPVAQSTGVDLFPAFACDNASVSPIPGVNTVFLTIDDHKVPDILSISATASGDGIISVPANGIGFMSVSPINIGAGDAAGSANAAVSVSVDDGSAGLPLLLQICETDASGVCLGALGAGPVNTVIGSGASFFAVFASDQNSGGIAQDAAAKRIYLRFKDASDTVRSVTSAAVKVP